MTKVRGLPLPTPTTPTPYGWSVGPDEDGNPNELEIQSENGQLVADVHGRTKEEREANATLIGAAKDLLAYAEMTDAIDRYERDYLWETPEGREAFRAVFVRHGWTESSGASHGYFARQVRKDALAKAGYREPTT